MKKQITTLALALTVMGVGAGIAQACDCGCGCDCKCGCNCPPPPQKMKPTPEQREAKIEQRLNKFENELGLTDAQKLQAKLIREKAKKQAQPLVDKKMSLIKEIKTIRENDNMTIKAQDKKVDTIQAQLKTVDQELRQIGQDSRKEFKAILTTEQQDKLAQMRMEHKKHDRMHRHHGPCPCGPRF